MEETSMWEEAVPPLSPSPVASLLDLDPYQLERAELRAAGVSTHRIEALYPATLEVLLPNLLGKMAEIADAELIHLCYAEQQLDSILYARETREAKTGAGVRIVLNHHHMQAYLHAAEHEAAFAEMKAYLLKRFGSPRFEQGTRDSAIAASKVLWCTHWLQVHRHELQPEYAAVAQALDARVCDILCLTPA